MENKLVVIEAPELKKVEQSKAEQIRKTFEPMYIMLDDFEQSYADVVSDSKNGIDESLIKRAKRLRLDIAKVRSSAENVRKKEKSQYLLAGKAIDGVNNILKWAVTEKEEKLKEIEKHFEIEEKKRIEQLQTERVELLTPYVEDAFMHTLHNMELDVWEIYLDTKKKQYSDRVEAEKKAEEERIASEKAEAEENERIRVENKRLEEEARERRAEEIRAEEMRAKEDAERKAKEEKERKEREEEERRVREAHEAQLKREREERERVEREEREKREELERQIAEKEEKERKEREEEERKRQERLNKGDVGKIEDMIHDLKQIKCMYKFDAETNKQMHRWVSCKIDAMIDLILKG
jgi:hypothetical protein